MKSLRVLIVLSALALGAGIASANCGTCEKKDHCDKAKCCECKCEKCAKGECCQKSCTEADKAKCDKEKMACCEEAAKAGKKCEKCNPPEKK